MMAPDLVMLRKVRRDLDVLADRRSLNGLSAFDALRYDQLLSEERRLLATGCGALPIDHRDLDDIVIDLAAEVRRAWKVTAGA